MEASSEPAVADEDLGGEDRKRAERLHGYLRSYFRNRPDRYRELGEILNSAKIPGTYYDYLADAYLRAVVAAAVGFIAGGAVSVFLAATNNFPSLFPTDAAFVPYLQAVVVAVLAGAVLGGATLYYLLRKPRAVAASRRRNIETTLPHAVFFMYTLSRGGMDTESVFRTLADAEKQYGEVSREIQGLVNDVDYFGTDIVTAMRNTRNRTPSEGFRSFLEDLLTVIDSGGDVTEFLDRERETYIERANDEQESFLETLALVSEVYLALLIAGPLFILVGLLVVAILGGTVMTEIHATVYVLIPLFSAMMYLGIDFVSNPYELTEWRMEAAEEDVTDGDDDRISRYRRARSQRDLRNRLRDPINSVFDRPALSLVATVPAAAVVLAAVVFTGVAEPSVEAFLSSPVRTTFWLVLAPAGVVAVPYTALYERRRKETAEIRRRLPNFLSILSNANETGMSLTESLDLVVRQTSGRLAKEMRTARNDIHWNGDVGNAFSRTANRVRVPSVSRVLKLIKEANRLSGDTNRVLTVAARDARTQERLNRNRYQNISSYVAVIVVGFLVYLFVVALLDAFYVQRVVDAAEATASAGGATEDTPISLAQVPAEEVRLAYFHSALVQAVCAGAISGKILRNDARAGLKYTVFMVALTVVVFGVVI
jgi:flagellar protein FlaJ